MDNLKKKQEVNKVIKLLEEACHQCIDQGEDLKIPNGTNPLVLVDSVVYTMITMVKTASLAKVPELKPGVDNDFSKDTDAESLKKQTWH